VSAQPHGADDGGRSGDDEETTKPGSAAGARGFSAQLRGVSLWDLVQMECLARSRLAVQVVGDGGVGYLYFDGGHIIHATTAVATGEAAALEILSWNNGSFQPSDRRWPERATIATSHEALILQAAQQRDEARGSNLVAFPARSGPPPSPIEEAFEELELIEVDEEGDGIMRSSNTGETLPAAAESRGDRGDAIAVAAAGRGESAGDFSVVLRLGANGAVIANRGGGEAAAETIAYAHRLVQLVGELLGLEPFSALECTFAEGRCIMFGEGDGEIVALRPRPDANLQALRERLGL
jgi:hypothetical protein